MLSESFLAQLLDHVFVRLNSTILHIEPPPPPLTHKSANRGMAISSSGADSIVSKLNQPATLIAAACLGLTIVAFCGFWSNTRARVPLIIDEKPAKAEKAKGGRVQQTLVEDQSALARLSSLVVYCSELLQATGEAVRNHPEEDTVMPALLAELPLSIAALCQIQQLLSIYHGLFAEQQGLQTCFETILTSVATIISSLDEELATVANCRCQATRHHGGESANFRSIERITQQLRDQRQGLLFMVDSMQRASQDSASSSSFSSYAESKEDERKPIMEATASDLKTFLEQPPDIDDLPAYSPPQSGELIPPDVKTPEPQPVEIDSRPINLTTATTGSIGDIFSAIARNEPEQLDKLLADEIDPNMTYGRLRRTPLHECARLNRSSCAGILLRHGALVDVDDGKGDAPLHLASWEGNVEVASLLLSSDADIDRLSGRDGYSALWCAITGRHIDMVRLLLKSGARISLRSPSETFPLHQAAITAQTAMCDLLSERGANVNCKDRDANTPLHYSATIGDSRTAKVLLREGADVNAQQERGLSPLHWAAHKNHVDMVQLLLDNGADIDCQSKTFATPLHCAAARGNFECVKILAKRGADRTIITSDWDGLHGTAAEVARRNGSRAIATFLMNIRS